MQNDWVDVLRNKLSNVMKLVVLGVGSEFRGDDCAGLLITDNLKKYFDSKPAFHEKIHIINASTAPENYTGEIIRFTPSHILIVDSASMDEKPGAIKIFTKETIAGISFCTHVLPLSMMLNYINGNIPVETLILGIQPKTTEFGDEPTQAVIKSVKETTSTLKKIIKAL
jgi:hydrogenase 3 maturation protease